MGYSKANIYTRDHRLRIRGIDMQKPKMIGFNCK
jgi:hypothetical protein